MSQVKVSVIMPAYNAERYIKESIESVLAQTYSDWELIIVDDSSQDRTQDIATQFSSKNERIHVLRNETNQGVAKSRNRGVAEATGEWIAFLDSDDIWDTQKLEKQLKLTEIHPDAALTYTSSSFMTATGERYSFILHAEPIFTYKDLLHRNLLSCSSVMAKRNWMLRYPFPSGELHEDYAVWLQMLRELPCAYGVDEPLLIYRLSNTSKSSNRVKSGQMIYRSYRQTGCGVISSVCLTLRYLPYSIGKRKKIYHSAVECKTE